MKAILSEIRGALAATLLLAAICCGWYPLLVFGAGQLLFRQNANGSLIVENGVVRGSSLIGQQFSGGKYFHPRPSAAGNGYDATASGGSNLGPTSQKLRDNIAQNAANYRSENGLETNAVIPADAVMASASGLDPHISIANALLQAGRVAKARGLTVEETRNAIQANTDQADLKILGEPGVNVLRLNLALDRLSSMQ